MPEALTRSDWVTFGLSLSVSVLLMLALTGAVRWVLAWVTSRWEGSKLPDYIPFEDS